MPTPILARTLLPVVRGSYERFVSCIKLALEEAVGRTFEVLFETVLCQVEGVLNKRLLIYALDEVDYRVVRPIDFVCPEFTFDHKRGEVHDTDNGCILPPNIKMLVILFKENEILDRYWLIGKEDYLLSLREKHSLGH